MAARQGSFGIWPGSGRGLSSRGEGEGAMLGTAWYRPRTNIESGETCWLSRTWEDTSGYATLLLVAAGKADTFHLTLRGN